MNVLNKEEQRLRDTLFSYINLTKMQNKSVIRVLASILNDLKKVSN